MKDLRKFIATTIREYLNESDDNYSSFKGMKPYYQRKDEFINSKTEDVEETTHTRVHLIDNGGSGWTYIRIYEVDGHEYLVNVSHGGMLHLESCPCKTK